MLLGYGNSSGLSGTTFAGEGARPFDCCGCRLSFGVAAEEDAEGAEGREAEEEGVAGRTAGAGGEGREGGGIA